MKSKISSRCLRQYKSTISVVIEHINSFRYQGEKLGMHIHQRMRIYK